jgi:hypothetical protein
MTNIGVSAERFFYTNPNTGWGIPCTVLSTDGDGTYEIELTNTGDRGLVTAGELYREDESGRYLGGPR